MKKMKFGYHTESWGWRKITPESFPVVLDEISNAGFDGFETHDVDILPYLKDEKKFLDMISERGLRLASIHVYEMFYLPGFHPTVWLRLWMYRHWRIGRRDLRRILKFAASVGCERLVIVGGPERKEGMREKDLVDMAGILNKVGKTCNEFGVEASYHPFYFNQIISNRNRLEKLCELTDPECVHLTVDIGHSTRNGVDPMEIIRTYKERVDHIHFRDITKDGILVELGEGTIDLRSIYNLLKLIGYHDWIIVEHDWVVLGRASTNPSQSVKKAKKYIDTYLLKPVQL